MDPIRNPFTPGAGAPPPELAGREPILAAAALALERVRDGRADKSQLLLGLRGVGKTVLLTRIASTAESLGYHVIQLEAPEGKRLATYLTPALQRALLRFSRLERAKVQARRALSLLRGFASAFKVKIGEIEVAVSDAPPVPASGTLELDLPELLVATGHAAQAAESAVALCIDEVQYLGEEDLRALIVALHRVAQLGLPLVLFGAGLPHVAALAGEARSYAERLFDFPPVGPLDAASARRAISEPLRAERVAIEPDALARIVEVTEGYPYFLQEWGKHTWNAAARTPITLADVHTAHGTATAALDQSFFRVRFDRLSPREHHYLRGMASLGPGPHRSGAIAAALSVPVASVAPLRAALIRKGMLWSPGHGLTAFTVPMFDDFMRRVMPSWRA